MTAATSHATNTVPEWFAAAVADPGRSGSVDVDGADISYRRWEGEPGRDCILVHGVAAHSHWWDHIAPALAGRRSVVAMDLSGHGDSGRRAAYSREQWASELKAVADAAGMDRPVVVGHSLGGMVALRAAAMFPERFAALAAIESNVMAERRPEGDDPAVLLRRPLRVYGTRAEAVSRWRPLPEEPVLDVVAWHVAEHSVGAADGGWTWKFDPEVFAEAVMLQGELRPLGIPVAVYRGENGSVTVEVLARIAELIGLGARTVTLPGAGHNVMLGVPERLTEVLSGLLSAWESAS